MNHEIKIERQYRHAIRELEIEDFKRRTLGVTQGSFHFITLTQDRSSSSEYAHKIWLSFNRFMKKANNAYSYETGNNRVKLSYIAVIEDPDKVSVRKHIHAIFFVPQSHETRFNKFFYGKPRSKASKLWQGEHYRGSFDIRPIRDPADVSEVFGYSTKKWGRNIDLNQCGANPVMKARIHDHTKTSFHLNDRSSEVYQSHRTHQKQRQLIHPSSTTATSAGIGVVCLI